MGHFSRIFRIVAWASFGLPLLGGNLPPIELNDFPQGKFWEKDYVNGVVATVNGRIITAGELRQELLPLLGQIESESQTGEDFQNKFRETAVAVLNAMVDRTLIVEDFEQSGMQMSALQKKFQLDEFIRTRFGGDRLTFMEKLHDHGKSLHQFKREMEEGYIVAWMMGRIHQSRAEISPWQVRAHYEANVDQYFQPASARIGQLCFKEDDPKVAEVVAWLAAGGSFKDSPAGESIANDWLFLDDLRPELADAVREVGAGKYSPPITIDGRIFILNVEELQAARRLEMEEVQDAIEEQILRERTREAQDRWLARLRRDAHIRLFL
jgi:hypothetical protein